VGEQKVISVPRNGIVSRGELEGLFVADPAGQVQFRLVKTGKTFGDRIEVLSGLEAGERVAVSEISKLRDGVRVEAE
jgi:multidrug efflux pump subunit AcrA (membrane-fusion protein)